MCLSYQQDGLEPKLVGREEAGALMWMWLADPEVLLVGHNVAYDVAVMMAEFPSLTEAFFRAYDANRVADTMLREKLILIALGRYKGWLDDGGVWTRPRFDLEGLAKRYLGRQLDKDTWRMRYGEFIDPSGRGLDLRAHLLELNLHPEIPVVPIEHWPEGAREYPKVDASSTMGVYLAQRDAEEYIPDQHNQARFALWKHLCSCRGLKTDPARVLQFKTATEEELEDIKERLIEAGLVRANGSRDTKAAQARMIDVCETLGIPVRKTKSDGIALDADACEETEDEILMDYAQYTILSAMLNKDVPMLLAGVREPIHTRFDMAESGRTTSSSNKALGAGTGNLQNLRRGAKKRKGESEEDYIARKKRSGDIRQCFVPRPGYVFLQADYEGLELRTLAQACVTLFGRSKLADVLNAGKDPHTEVASVILWHKVIREKLGLTGYWTEHRDAAYQWCIENKKDAEVKNARQTAKVANFGFPGGLGAKKLVLFARKSYGVVMTEAEAKDLKKLWLETYPEMHLYFEHMASKEGAALQQLFSNRLRGGCTFCQACNTIFQGLGADASQQAGWLLAKACYVDRDSPLFGCRIVNYIHDEFFIEARESSLNHEQALELERLMVLGAKQFIPDVVVSAPPAIMRCWSKDAEAVYDTNKRLIPWSPS